MNREMLTKLQSAKSVEEVIAIAKEYGQEMTEKQAGELLDRLNAAGGELPDDLLEAAAGGFQGYLSKESVPSGAIRSAIEKKKASDFHNRPV